MTAADSEETPFTWTEVEQLAVLFHDEAKAKAVLIRVGFSPSLIRWDRSPWTFWGEMCRLLNGGAVPGGVAALRRQMRRPPFPGVGGEG